MEKERIHVVYCGDVNYVPMLGISMTSVIWNNPEERLAFHLLVDDIHKQDLAKLQKMLQLYRNVESIQVHRIPADSPELAVFCSVKSSYAAAVNYRLLLPKILGTEVRRVLYLDGDVICCASLAELQQTDLSGILAAGVPDPLEAMHKKRMRLEHYVNSGVLLINLELWRSQDILGQLISFYQKNEQLGYPDQDAINTVCQKHLMLLPQRWNYPVSCNFTTEGRSNEIAPDAVFCHFLGPITKPWYVTCLDIRAELWRSYRARSFWYGMALHGSGTKLEDEMRVITRMFEDGDGQAAYQRYRALIRGRDPRFEPIVLKQHGWQQKN